MYVKTTGDTSVDGLTLFKINVNNCYKKILNEFARPDTEKTITRQTVAAQRGYQLPVDASWVKSVTIMVGTRVYTLVEEPSQDKWNYITAIDRQSAVPERFFVRKRFGVGGQVIDIDPIPSSSSNTIKVVYEPTDRDMQYDVYSTGTINAVNGSETITGIGTTFLPRMVGQYLVTTDGLYYRIAQYSSPTSLILENVYIGASSAGASYGIHDMFNIPEDMHTIPVDFGFMDYYGSKENAERQKYYDGRYTVAFKQARARYGTKSRSNIVDNNSAFESNLAYPRQMPVIISGGE